MRDGLYSIDMPVTALIDYAGLPGYVVSDLPIQVEDWAGLRQNVCEGQEIMLVGSVPEQQAVIQLHAIVAEFDDELQVVKVVV